MRNAWIAIGLCVCTAAQAQEVKEVKQDFGKQEEVKKVEWKAAASVGFSAAFGNTNLITLTGGGKVSRNDGKNKVALQIDGLYSAQKALRLRSGVAAASSVNDLDDSFDFGNPTAGSLLASLRYDRFFTKNNSVYATIYGGLDEPAAKKAIAGGQAGYARQIVKTRMHTLSGEAGYDFTYFDYATPTAPPPGFENTVLLHSGRLFLGYSLAIRDNTSLDASVEGLINFNSAHIGDQDFGAGQASRVLGKLAFTTQIWKPLSLRVAETVKFNNAPGLNAKLPPIAAGSGFVYPDQFKYNSKVDSLTELSLVITFI